ncbi:YbjN domain-containing protein [Ectothiorhodospiraceae bacterium 2226]|nr:YbjN domain-containing protein [Ectothiorhodospiraceae bacterium 2226]
MQTLISRAATLWCCMALALLLSSTAHGSERVIGKLTSAQVVSVLKGEGVADARADDDDDILFSLNGYNVVAFVRENDYTVLRFYSAMADTAVTLQDVNEWNRTRLFTKAFLDSDGDPALEMDVDVAGGITRARLRDAVRTYLQVHGQFLAEVVDAQ